MNSFPPWILAARDAFDGLIARDQLPHALLIHGPAGCGRRLLALSLIGRLLDIDGSDSGAGLVAGRLLDPELVQAHADFRLVQPDPKKRDISIDQIRELLGFVSLTSHQGGPKVVLVSPAQEMNRHASNSLLKTLEEPPGHCLIILVTDAPSRLPPTLVSRCHRLRVAAPPAAVAVDWLREQDPDVDWGLALELAGGAPIGAIELERAGFPKQAGKLEKDIAALLDRRTTPVEVAGRWSSLDPDLCLRWLYHRVGREIKVSISDADHNFDRNLRDSRLQTDRKMLNMERSFECLRDINELRRLRGAGLNKDLQLASLLNRWFGEERP